MSAIGITGHQRLQDPDAWSWVAKAMERAISGAGESLRGLTSLAIGADQLFAQLVLRMGGSIEAIVPFEGYERTFKTSKDQDAFKHLMAEAARIEVLAGQSSDEEAYLAAGKRVVDLADTLLAVWDGQPAGGLGGTADIVAYARSRAKKVIHIDPVSRTVMMHE